MKTKFNKLWIFILCVIFSITLADNHNTKVYVVPIQNTIDLGIPAFVKRAIDTAEKDDAPFDGGKPFIPQETAAVTATTATAETDTSEEYSYFSKLAEGN